MHSRDESVLSIYERYSSKTMKKKYTGNINRCSFQVLFHIFALALDGSQSNAIPYREVKLELKRI